MRYNQFRDPSRAAADGGLFDTELVLKPPPYTPEPDVEDEDEHDALRLAPLRDEAEAPPPKRRRAPSRRALVLSGRVDEGLALFGQLVKERPDNPWLLFRQAYVLGEHGRDAEAEAAYRAVLRLRPDDAEAHNNLAVVLGSRGPGAGENAERQTERDRDRAKALFRALIV